MIPTHDQLRDEVLKGPLSAQLAPHWNNVFQPPDADPPIPADSGDHEAMWKWKATCASNAVKAQRAGRLTSDGAYDVAAVLHSSGRLAEMGWSVDPALVAAAHEGARS